MQAPLAPGTEHGVRFFRVVIGLIRKRFAEVGGWFTGCFLSIAAFTHLVNPLPNRL